MLFKLKCIKVLHPKEAIDQIGFTQQKIKFTSIIRLKNKFNTAKVMSAISELIQKEIDDIDTFQIEENVLQVENVRVELRTGTDQGQNQQLPTNDLLTPEVHLSWNLEDEELGSYLCAIIKDNLNLI